MGFSSDKNSRHCLLKRIGLRRGGWIECAPETFGFEREGEA
jgi:hypothetical protein